MLTLSKKRKNKPTTDPGVADEIMAELRSINDLPEVVAAGQLYQNLQAEKRRVMDALQRCTGPGAAGPTVQFDPADDVAALLGGADVATLMAPVEEGQYYSLRRQLRALEGAIPAAQDRKREVYFTACRTELDRLRPLLQESYAGVLLALESFLFDLRQHAALLKALTAKGLYHDSLGSWNLTPTEDRLLFGGADQMALERYLEVRREATGIDPEKE